MTNSILASSREVALTVPPLRILPSEVITAPSQVHQIQIAEMPCRAEDSKTIVTYSCFHGFSEKRVDLAQTVYEWLASQGGLRAIQKT